MLIISRYESVYKGRKGLERLDKKSGFILYVRQYSW